MDDNLKKWMVATGLREEPWCSTFAEVEKQKADARKNHFDQRRKERKMNKKEKREHPLKFDRTWADDRQLAEHDALVGMPVFDAQGATTIPSQKPWEQTRDPWVLNQRVEQARKNEIALQVLRQQKRAADQAEAKRIQAGAGDVSKAPRDAVLARMKELGIIDPVLTDGIKEPEGSAALPPPRMPPSWRDSLAVRNRQQRQQQAQQPPPGNAAARELSVALKKSNFSAKNLSDAAFDLYKRSLGLVE